MSPGQFRSRRLGRRPGPAWAPTTLDLEQSRTVVHAALDHGILSSKPPTPTASPSYVSATSWWARRHDVLIAPSSAATSALAGRATGWTEAHVARAGTAPVGRQLACRLRTDWMDPYRIHQPDPATPVEEPRRPALNDLVHEGKVRAKSGIWRLESRAGMTHLSAAGLTRSRSSATRTFHARKAPPTRGSRNTRRAHNRTGTGLHDLHLLDEPLPNGTNLHRCPRPRSTPSPRDVQRPSDACAITARASSSAGSGAACGPGAARSAPCAAKLRCRE
jgi:hypothetical protein